MKKNRWLLLAGIMAISSATACGGDDDTVRLDGGPDGSGDASATCQAAADCDDGVYCNGEERCAPGAAGANSRGCVSGMMACGAGATCDEATRSCGPACSNPDADGDGHDAVECGGDDCDDADPNRFPGNLEVCDLENHDEDCDHTTYGDRDLDGDGYHDARCCNEGPGGVLFCGEDCDDTRRGTNPNVPEVCDARDNDCDGLVDEEVEVDGFADMDRDLHGSALAPISGCPGWPGVSASMLDCDDDDPTINGPQPEFLDGKDNDCDGIIDEDVIAVAWYPDADGDGFGVNELGSAVFSMTPLAGHSILPFDCEDTNASRHPRQPELCNALDDDCDPRTQFMLGVNDSEDDDGDGYPDANCPDVPAARADCDDTDPHTYPGAPERCDYRDNDCDGVVDEECVVDPVDPVDPVDFDTFFFVMDTLVIPEPGPDETIPGFNLDDRISDETDSLSCFHIDLISPSGDRGIDNTFSQLNSAAGTSFGSGGFNGSISSRIELGSSLLISLQPRGTSIDATVYNGTIDMPALIDGRLVPGQTFDYASEPVVSSMSGARRGNTISVSFADGHITIPLESPIPLRGVRLRADLSPGGRLSNGVLGGHVLVDDLVDAYSGDGIAPSTLRAIFGTYADMNHSTDTEDCAALSVGMTFSAVSAVRGEPTVR